MYEGEKVPLDLPMLNEDVDPKTLQNEFEKEFNVRTSLIGGEKLSILIRGDIYEEFDDMVDFIESKGFKVNADLSNFEYEREFDDDRAYYPFIIFSQDSINEAREPLKDISKEYVLNTFQNTAIKTQSNIIDSYNSPEDRTTNTRCKLMGLDFFYSMMELGPDKMREFGTDMVYLAQKKSTRKNDKFGPFGKVY